MGNAIGKIRPTFGTITLKDSFFFEADIADPIVRQRHF